jgi:DNA-binding transcriptional regulator PaaX
MNKRELANKLSFEMFEFARSLGELTGDIVFTPYGRLRLNKRPAQKMTYYRRLKKYEKHGLLKKISKSTGDIYTLSAKAKQLRREPTIKELRGDKLSTIVMFDIPESQHRARDNFRRYLIRNGYTLIQKSVFISPFQVPEELLNFAKELGILSGLTVLSARIERLGG